MDLMNKKIQDDLMCFEKASTLQPPMYLLHQAAYFGDIDAIKKIIDEIDVIADGMENSENKSKFRENNLNFDFPNGILVGTPLVIASRYGYHEACLFKIDEECFEPKNYQEIVKILVEKGANVNMRTCKGLTALDHAEKYILPEERKSRKNEMIRLIKSLNGKKGIDRVDDSVLRSTFLYGSSI